MDAELLSEDALRSTFADILAMKEERGEDTSDFNPMDMDEEEMDMHLLMNLMQSHSEAMGIPQGPAQALLAQLGLSLPRPPPMHEGRKKE
jgi:hypothetical protein